MKNMLSLLLTFVTLSVFAQQRIHPDLNVPKVSLDEFDRHRLKIEAALAEVNFNQEGKVEALYATVPDYKIAYEAFKEKVTVILEAYQSGMDKLKVDAEIGAEKIKVLQGEYSSKLFALEDSIKMYPSSADTFKKALDIESNRMKTDLSNQYDQLIRDLRSNYAMTLANALTENGSYAVNLNVPKPNFVDEVKKVVSVGGLSIASIILWVFPAPVPLLVSPNSWIISIDDYNYDDWPSFFTIFQDKVDSLIAGGSKKAKYIRSVNLAVTNLFNNCKTGSCVYELSKDYKKFFSKIIKINKDIRVGDVKLNSLKRIKLKRINKILSDASDQAAASLPTAIYINN